MQPEAIRLEMGEDRFAEISPIGGTTLRFVWDGLDIIYPFFITKEGKQRGGIPICFPFFGPAPAEFSEIFQHGWLRHEELTLEGNGAKTFLSLVGAGGKKSRICYPWLLDYRVNFILDHWGLKIILKVRRLNDGIVRRSPVNPAFHPYISNLGNAVAKANGVSISSFEKKSQRFPFSREAIADLGKIRVKIISDGFRRGSFFNSWSDLSEKYFCLESVFSPPEYFNTRNGEFLQIDEIMEVSLSLFPM